jgi:hypothetical protein
MLSAGSDRQDLERRAAARTLHRHLVAGAATAGRARTGESMLICPDSTSNSSDPTMRYSALPAVDG